MAEAQTQSPEDRIKEAIWQWSGWTIMILLTFLAGVAVAWLIWGDAPRLRQQVADLTKSVSAARVEREDAQVKQGALQHANEKLQAQIDQLKAGGAAPQ
jgi:hypothetical protein